VQLSNKWAENSARYSSASNFPSVGLCRSGLAFFALTSCDGFGLPTRSRAISRTILAAEKILFFGLRGMGCSEDLIAADKKQVLRFAQDDKS
jgi:hypothetical protein